MRDGVKPQKHTFFKRFIFYVCMYLLVCIYVHYRHAGCFGGKVGLSDSWGLELQLLIACVGSQLRSSGSRAKTACVLELSSMN